MDKILLLNTDEHRGWEAPVNVRVVRVFDGPDGSDEYAWLTSVSSDVLDERFDVMVQPSSGEPVWRDLEPGERLPIAAWRLQGEEIRALGALPELPRPSWRPGHPVPDLRLWIACHESVEAIVPTLATVEDLKSAMAARGLHADEVNRAEDPEARKDEGAVLVRRLPEGQVDVVVMDRGFEHEPERFPSEVAAVQSLAISILTPPQIVRIRTDEERRADGERMQARAREVLRDLERRQRQAKRSRVTGWLDRLRRR